MPDINILSPHVADLIAAGEVVERPSSVIKELLENAFDAKAKTVTVEIKGGGMTYLRVTDNGCGMSPEDAGICFQRHATSKLRDQRSLEAISTMGFRGEALAAISAVSRIELQTRKYSDEAGTRVTIEAGDIIEITACGCPVGTTIIVRDLFYNTPARLKFMKGDRAEGSNCVSVALRCALGRPDVSVRLIKDGQEEFFSPGDGKISSSIYSLLGRDIAKELLELHSDDEGIKVTGFVGSPKFGHGNRSKQFFFVNGRCIRSALLQAAVEQAYKNNLLTGRFPSCVVCLSISPASVDVNIHPAKTEIKFREERRVFNAVYYAALSAIKGEGQSSFPSEVSAPKRDFYQTMTADEYQKKASPLQEPAHSPSKPSPSQIDRGTVLYRGSDSVSGGGSLNDSRTPYNAFKSSPLKSSVNRAGSPIIPQSELPAAPAPEQMSLSATKETEESLIGPLSAAISDFRIIGEAMNTYIILQRGEELVFIDKHAAHERMIFDRIKARGHQIMSQTLLSPIPLNLSREDIELLEKNLFLLSHLGFEIEPYGAHSIILRAAPADTDAADVPAMVEEICEKLRNRSFDEADVTDEILHTVACKAAIKAGWTTTDTELEEIARRVLSGEVKYCPHGRPVSFTITKKQLDKEFSRIV